MANVSGLLHKPQIFPEVFLLGYGTKGKKHGLSVFPSFRISAFCLHQPHGNLHYVWALRLSYQEGWQVRRIGEREGSWRVPFRYACVHGRGELNFEEKEKC